MKARFIIFITLLLTLCISQKANAEESESVIAIENVSYQYELFRDRDGILDCTGTFVISARMNPADEVSHVVLERTVSHYIPGNHFFFSIKSDVDFEPGKAEITVDRDDISWGTYFDICVHYKDKTTARTEIVCTNDYMNPDDLESILKDSGIDEVDSDLVSITANDKTLTIETSGSMPLRIFDLQGTTLYSGITEGEVSIPVNAPFAIVQYEINGKIATRKILIK
ncbi:MAG: hypothetical protein J6C59_06220 [Muribaculaceae bacterium]|nr:hypothetical protein [Muribaculaceae bacterium]